MSDFATFIKEKARRENERFFGKGNRKMLSNKYFTYKHVLDDDTIIINTNNVRVVKDSLILVVGDDKAVYLKDWSARKAHNYDWGIDFWIVKLSRAFFKVYTFKSRIDSDLCFDNEVQDFDRLLEIAKEQDIENMKVANGFMGE